MLSKTEIIKDIIFRKPHLNLAIFMIVGGTILYFYDAFSGKYPTGLLSIQLLGYTLSYALFGLFEAIVSIYGQTGTYRIEKLLKEREKYTEFDSWNQGYCRALKDVLEGNI
jgi:hypothetical protein